MYIFFLNHSLNTFIEWTYFEVYSGVIISKEISVFIQTQGQFAYFLGKFKNT